MDKYFRTKEGVRINIIDHTLEQLNKYPNLKVRIGTDAQDKGRQTVFSTVIAYRYGNNGAHFVYYRERVPVVNDIFTRLFQEGERTIKAGKMLIEELSVDIEALEFDYSDISKTKSTPIINAVKGWAIGEGFKPCFKSDGQYATKAADQVCRHEDLYL